jgi:hypothetical protein
LQICVFTSFTMIAVVEALSVTGTNAGTGGSCTVTPGLLVTVEFGVLTAEPAGVGLGSAGAGSPLQPASRNSAMATVALDNVMEPPNSNISYRNAE